MNKLTVAFLVVASCVAISSAALIKPQKKMYFTVPLGPAPAAAPAPAPAPAAAPPPPPPAADSPTTEPTTASSDDTAASDGGSTEPTTAASDASDSGPSTEATTAAPQMALQIIPLFQLIGMSMGMQGMNVMPDGSVATAISWVPLFTAIGTFFTGLFSLFG